MVARIDKSKLTKLEIENETDSKVKDYIEINDEEGISDIFNNTKRFFNKMSLIFVAIAFVLCLIPHPLKHG